MSYTQITKEIIEKLQEENSNLLETLHKAQDNIKFLEKQLADKDALIKILNNRLRYGSDSYSSMSNRQNELTIKHLELQIEKLLRENQDLELQINALKSNICSRCETKLILDVEDYPVFLHSGKQTFPVPALKRPSRSASSVSKKVTVSECSDRQKTLERIIEHKDKRIDHLAKEVQKLTQVEKELTAKIYRLTKLLPMSHMSPESLTECLLKEIQQLESQMQCYSSTYSNLQKSDPTKHKKQVNEMEGKKDYAFKNKAPQKDDNLGGKQDFSLKGKEINPGIKGKIKSFYEAELVKKEDEVLMSSLRELYKDICELKHFFATENEKACQAFKQNSLKNDFLKLNLKEIINKLNGITENIQQIIKVKHLKPFDFNNVSNSVQQDNVILRLQERLRESLDVIAGYENENKHLKEELSTLQHKINVERNYHQSISADMQRSMDDKGTWDRNRAQNTNEVQNIKELLAIKERQLSDAENHIETLQNYVKLLQALQKPSEDSKTQMSCVKEKISDTDDALIKQLKTKEKISDTDDALIKQLKTKLDVAEKNIKQCEEVIEDQQNTICNLEEENMNLKSDLHVVKSDKVLSEVHNKQNMTLKSQLAQVKNEVAFLKSENKDLNDKIILLEEENSKLLNNLKDSDNSKFSLSEIQAKLNTEKKYACDLKNTVGELKSSLKLLEEEKTQLQTRLREAETRIHMSKSYEEDLQSLKNKLMLQEQENQKLKDSLHAFESKAMEMSYYRKTLHQEIENLCEALLENSDDDRTVSRRKAIYKAAVLRSAQALLRLGEDSKLEDSGKSNALDEMKHHVQVYLTEVARIHELLTIKEQQREELLKEYLEINESLDSAMQGSSLKHELLVHDDIPGEKQESMPHAEAACGASGTNANSSGTLAGISDKGTETKKANNLKKSEQHVLGETGNEIKSVVEDLNASKILNSYLLSSCSKLEEQLEKERTEHAKCEKELEVIKENMQEVKMQLNVKNDMLKRFNTIIEMMRSKECNDEITMEQLKSEIKWLIDENQKIFEKITATQSELCKCKEENSRIQNDLADMKRQLVNEKFEHAKVNNELKHLRMQISNSHSSLNGDS
ncbi:GRIP and coiled-coil domain-containing protein 2-like [Stegodyphus dumicola]|uniref:GRIP and coiled-coil domain-containing protein 2-like n=1 Tax=Stegodyphus dumicola TaxID=202533 RepID=UPI0015A941BD|nr:GRIP and coiled-coil domain-containing protein 2-like [Stegodyphus dumicola]